MIDLRSDTLTRPTQAMIEAMAEAMGDPGLGDQTLFGDPLVARLEETAARLTGKDAALFLPSGSMANLAALMSHRMGGIEVVIDNLSHIARMEFGSASVAAGLHPVRVPSVNGEMDLEALQGALDRALSRQGMPPAAVCLESSHNFAGGRAPSLAFLAEACRMAHRAGSPVHLDGARIFNAAVALGRSVADVAASCDSVCFCVSKGLSAPYGALLAGTGPFIKRARTFCRMLGGGMRQIGGMAAAALVALETMPPLLAEDHRRAKAIWRALRDIDPDLADRDEPQTNIVLLRTKGRPAQEWVTAMAGDGVHVQALGPDQIRMVTHRHITDEDVLVTGQALQKACASLGPGAA